MDLRNVLAEKHQSFLSFKYSQSTIKYSESTQSNLSFTMFQLLLSRTELTKFSPSILIESCDHTIYPGLTILFLYDWPVRLEFLKSLFLN